MKIKLAIPPVFFLSVISGPLLAQSESNGSSSDQLANDKYEPEPERPALEEVVVTTERRAVSLQDLAGTAVAFTGEDLSKIGLQNLTDLSESVVGLEIGNNRGNVEVWIRGVGNPNNTELGDPAAAMHIDGVYIPRPRGIGGAFFDLERVEINVGPQGTLRGRNAMAGSINAIPWRPGLGVWNMALEAEYGNYDQLITQAVINAPLGEHAATRLALLKQDHDPYYNDVGPNNIEGPEGSDNFASRLQFLFEPTDRLSILLAADYLTEKGTGYTGTNYANPLGNDVDPEDIDDPRDVYLRGFTPIQDTKHWGAKFEVAYDFDHGTLEFNYGHRDLVYDYQASTPLSPDYPSAVENLGGVNIGEAIDDFSRFQDVTDSVSDVYELRYYTSADNSVYFTTGLFYFVEDQYSFLGATGDGQTFFQGIEFNQPNTDTESFSIYGDATWNISDRTRLTAGLRWTDDHKERQGVNAQYRVQGQGLDNITGNEMGGLGFRFGTEGFEFAIQDRTIFNPDIDGDGLITEIEYYQFILDGVKTFGERDNFDEALLNVIAGNPGATPCIDTRLGDNLICNGDFYNGVFPTAVSTSVVPQDGEIDSSFVDWRLRIEHDITADNLLYGLIATGHKSGGFNDTFAVLYRDRDIALDDDDPLRDLPCDPENFELEALDGELNKNGEQIKCLKQVFSELDKDIIRYQNGAGELSDTYDEERVVYYELGSKNEFDIGSISARLNGSLFYQDYTNQVFCNVTSIEQLVKGRDAPASAESSVQLGVNFCFNADETEIYGSQLEGELFFPYELTFKWSGLWLQSEIQKSDDVIDSRFQADQNIGNDDFEAFVSVEGNDVPRTPEFSLNLSLSQHIDLPIGTFDYIVSASWRDEQHLTIFNGIDYQQPDNPRKRLDDLVPAYWTYDFGMGFNVEDTNLRFEAFINNITDEVRPAAILITQNDNTRFFTRPRTYGARIKWQL